MASAFDWKVPPEIEPQQSDYTYDLARARS